MWHSAVYIFSLYSKTQPEGNTNDPTRRMGLFGEATEEVFCPAFGRGLSSEHMGLLRLLGRFEFPSGSSYHLGRVGLVSWSSLQGVSSQRFSVSSDTFGGNL